MLLKELEKYVNELPNLTKIDLTIELGDEIDEFYVTKTKETYIYETEADADFKVNDVKDDHDFAGVDKKFKAGKVNRAGDCVRPDQYQVVVKLNK